MPTKRMNPDQYELKSGVAETKLDILFEHFKKHPGAEEYSRLEKAMLGFQETKLCVTADDMVSWVEEEDAKKVQ